MATAPNSALCLVILVASFVSVFSASVVSSTTGTVACWPPGAPVPSVSLAQLHTGYLHWCGIYADNATQCWGDDSEHQVSDLPVLQPPAHFVSMALGSYHTCGLLNNGTVLCWGYDDNNQLAVPEGVTFTQLVAGWRHSCGIASNQSTVCWGWPAETSSMPTGVQFTQLTALNFHTCGLKPDGTVQCWGTCSPNVDACSPPAGLTFTQLSAGDAFTCGLQSNGTAVCWGTAPANVTTDALSTVTGGWGWACGVGRSDGMARCWGSSSAQVTGPTDSGYSLAQLGLSNSYTCGLYSASPSPSPSLTPLAFPSPSSSPRLPSPSQMGLVSNTTTGGGSTSQASAQPAPQLQFAVTQPQVAIAPTDQSGTVQKQAKVEVTVGTVGQTSSNGTVLSTAVSCPGAWVEASNSSDATALGARQSFAFTSYLVSNATLCSSNSTSKRSATGAAKLELQFFTFDQQRNVSLGSSSSSNASAPGGSTTNETVSFTISPSFTKFTVRLTDWLWADESAESRAEVRVDIVPAFSSYSQLPDSPSARYSTTFVLNGQNRTTADGRQVETHLRLLRAVELDGTLVLGPSINATADSNSTSGSARSPVEFRLDVARSQLVLSFARFNHTLVYDPDMGLLLQGKSDDGSGGGGDNLGLIIGVAVAVPVAVVVVLVVVAVAYIVARQRAARRHHSRDSVNFDASDSQL